jgi:hypothetical protein
VNLNPPIKPWVFPYGMDPLICFRDQSFPWGQDPKENLLRRLVMRDRGLWPERSVLYCIDDIFPYMLPKAVVCYKI